ncbi:MAG: signal transduction histidine kinase/ActR/RegA family two-component response regulator [Verrucomicrobiales bacterium]|jgi:signal transduction histidine kinase/ActR/RegA family two-component response regulator
MNSRNKLVEQLIKEPIRVVGGTFLGAFVALVGFQYLTERTNHRERIEEKMARAVKGAGALESSESGEVSSLILSALATADGVEYVAVLDATRTIIANKGDIISKRAPAASVNSNSSYDYFLTGMQISRPIRVDGMQAGWLYVEANMNAAYFATTSHAAVLGLILAGVLGITIIVLRKQLGKSLEPVGEMADTLDKVVKTGNFGFRAPRYPDGGEQGKLIDRVNAVLRTVETKSIEMHEMRSQLANAKRVEAIGLLASGVANDLNNILGPLLAFPDMVERKLAKDDDEGRELLAMMRDSAAGAAQAAQDLLSMASRKAAILEPLELKPLVLSCIQGQGFQCVLENTPGIRLETRLEEKLMIDGSKPHLRRAIVNLLTNAVEAMDKEGGRLFVDASSQNFEDGDTKPAGVAPGEYAVLRIRDTGKGMVKDELGRMFEPFFTTKAGGAGSSSGVGLAVVDGVAQEHGAVLNVASRKGRGTRVELYFPLSKAETNPSPPIETEESEKKKAESLRGTERVLIVDDFEVQRRLTDRILSQQGYETKCVPSGREALELLAHEKFDIMVLDMIMEDGLDGLDTFTEVLKIAPGTRCLIMTGLSDSERVEEVLRLGASDCLSKPYTMEDLARAVRRGLDEPAPQAIRETDVVSG